MIAGAGTRARIEARQWARADAADLWLARQGLAATPTIEDEEEQQFQDALRRARNKNWRETKRPGYVTIGPGEGEFDLSTGDLRIDDPLVVNKARQDEEQPDLPDLQDIRTHYPETWARMLKYLKGCPAARRVAWLLSEGIPRDRMPEVLGVRMRSVNYAHVTLRDRMEAMRLRKDVPEGQPEKRGAEHAAPQGIDWNLVRKIREELPTARVEPTPCRVDTATDLFEAASMEAPETPAPKKEKPKRAKAEKPSVQLQLFDCESVTTEADDESYDNIQHIEYLFFYRPRRAVTGLHQVPG